MSLGVPLHDALHEKQTPHSLCGACSLEVHMPRSRARSRMYLHIQSKHAVALTGVSTSRHANQVSVEGAAWFSMGT